MSGCYLIATRAYILLEYTATAHWTGVIRGGISVERVTSGVAVGVCVSQLSDELTPFPPRLLSSRHHRLKTFAKRTFIRWRALPLGGRDLTRVWHRRHGFRTLAIWLQSALEVSLGPYM